MRPIRLLRLLIVKILDGKLTSANYKSTTQTTDLIVMHKNQQQVLLRSILMLLAILFQKNLGLKVAKHLKELLLRLNHGLININQRMRFQTHYFLNRMTSEISMDLILLIL